MRNLVRHIVEGYKSVKLVAQDEGYVVFRGKEPDTKQPVDIKVLARLLAQDPRLAHQFRGLARTIRCASVEGRTSSALPITARDDDQPGT